MKSEDFIQLRLLLGTYVTAPISVGLAGFEPAHDGTKNRCLTAWL